MLRDFRLKILLVVLTLGVIAITGVFALEWLMGNARLRFGDTAAWGVYESPYNNISFRYPTGSVEVITPDNERNVPVSVVLAGERGENMLIQFGTLRNVADDLQDIEDVLSWYKSRFAGTRKTRESIRHERQGRGGVTLIQEETNGRTIGEAFFYDPAVVDISHAPGEVPEYEIREISLQLPQGAPLRDRRLYTDLYLMMLSTVEFLAEPSDEPPETIPSAWRETQDLKNGFSIWLPADWEITGTHERLGIREVVLATRFGERNESAAEYTIGAFPEGTAIDAPFLDSSFAQPFRDTAFPDSLVEETLVMPEVGEAISMEARQPKKNPVEGNELTTLLLIVGGEETPQAGRGYVISSRLPDGFTQQELRFDQIRAMTRSFRLISSEN